MTLQSHTVNACTIGLDQLDDASRALGLLRAVLEIVIVVEEAGVRVSCLGVLEGYGDVGLADGLVEDVVAVGSIFIKGCLMSVLYHWQVK